MSPSDTTPQPTKTRASFSLDYRLIILVLLATIGAMFLIWRPWAAPVSEDDRTINVTGEAKVTATPDEYVFYPTYEFKNADKDLALKDLTKKSDEVVAKLKELGVADNKIKTNSDGNDYPVYYPESDSKYATYSLRLTVTVDSREHAQKIQDYLLTTTPQGSVSPQATFSDAKRKELENQARDEATKDARAKADQSAKNLGFKVGKVKSVSDGSGFNGDYIRMQGGTEPSGIVTDGQKLAVQPGENELHYSVTVTYFVR